jgi:hypothetical protein
MPVKSRNVPAEVARLKGVVGGLARRGADPERLEAARAELRTAAAEVYITKVVDAAPPLSDEQRARLAALLRPTGDGGA